MGLGAYLRDSFIWHRRCADVIDQIAVNNVPASTGSANAYVLTPTVPSGALANGEVITFTPNFTNTGAATANVSGLGAVTIKRYDNTTDLYAGEIVSGYPVSLMYVSATTTFRLLTVTPIAQTYAPSYSASGSMTFTSVSTTYARYTIRQSLVRLYLEFGGTTGGVASTDVIASIPITASSPMTTMCYLIGAAGAPIIGYCEINSGSATFKRIDGTNFALTSAIRARMIAEYEI